MDKIDFVITWVDGNDIEWRKEKDKYSEKKENIDNSPARYRDWETLKYWFRGVEKYAPWVNKIHFVTYGHLPSWLDTSNPKLNIVKHEDFIPKEYLPVFNVNPIEMNFHRIKGISEKFVYFNDDMFIVNKVKQNDFFVNNLPCDSAILNVHCAKKSNLIHDICNNDIGIINEYYDFKSILKNNFAKFFNLKYGIKNNIQNVVLSSCPRFPGFKQFHTSSALLKSTYEELWKKEYETLNATCMNKFRSKLDVNQWLVKEWQIVTNKFTPSYLWKISKFIQFRDIPDPNGKPLEDFKKALKKKKIVCINDSNAIQDFETLKSNVISVFEKKFPDKSSFEI